MIEIPEKHELYLAYGGLEYYEDHLYLDDAMLYGPALTNLVQLSEEDNIILDFSSQYTLALPDPKYYMADFFWRGVEYTGKTIDFYSCWIVKNGVTLLDDLSNKNFFLIDMSLHEEDKHANHLTYPCWVLNNDGLPRK